MVRTLPVYIGDTTEGKIFWALVFSIGVVLPISMPRTVSPLRYGTFFSVLAATTVVLAIVGTCLFNRDITPELGYSLRKTMTDTNTSMLGFLNSFPLVIFAFMYQPNIPAIYSELNRPEPHKMKKVLMIASIVCITIYMMSGYFGNATFVAYTSEEKIMGL